MLFESPWGHHLEGLLPSGSFILKTVAPAGGMLFESPWGHHLEGLLPSGSFVLKTHDAPSGA